MSDEEPPFEDIGPWSEVKLDIVRKYAEAFATITSARRFTKIYIDGFAGAGLHRSRLTGRQVPGSPLTALAVEPAFDEFHFVDTNPKKVAWLRALTEERPQARVHEGDCNEVLLRDVLPRVRFEDYRRALCLLDPYGLHLRWEVVAAAGATRAVDVLLNFPILDMNRNALLLNPSKVRPEQAARMTAFWGDDSWRVDLYRSLPGFFGPVESKQQNQAVVDAFRKRLVDVGGFKHVSRALPMVNRTGATVYYLLLASQKQVAVKVMNSITRKYPRGGGA